MYLRDWLACLRRTRSGLRRRAFRRWEAERLEDRTLLSGSPVLVKDINTTLITSPGSIGERVDVNGTLYFTMSTPTTGSELWKSDGTVAGTVLVRDILPGPTGSGVANLTNVNGTLFFSASDGVSGTELWKSDGTEAGTVRVMDLLAGSNGSSPSSFISYNGMLYFSGYSSGKGVELFKSDGTEAGTVLVKDIEAGIFSSTPSKMTIVNGLLYFTAYTTANGYELWKSDGTDSGTVLVKDIYPLSGNASTSPSNLTDVSGTLFFTANDGTNGVELWKTDGTDAGTFMVEDILPGSGTSSPSLLTNVNGKLFFRASDGINGAELWTSDGTEVGTVMVENLTSGSTGSTLTDFVSFNNQLYFSANDGASGTELWQSDGTEAGTKIVKDVRSGSSSGNVKSLIQVGNKLFFSASDTTGGQELWSSDGTEAGTVRVKDIRAGSSSSNPAQLINVGGTLFFQATSGSTGIELWKSDGTDAGTVAVKPFYDGTNDSNPNEFVTIGGTTYFVADDGTSGKELWKTDGTTAGTVRVKDINVGASTSDPKSLVEVNGVLYFSAFGSGSGYELWRSDGTDVGTYRVKDIASGSSSSSPTLLTNVNGTLYFRATDGTSGVELWKSDGTEAGTVRVKDINPTGNSDPQRFVFLNGGVYFTATDGTTGTELWKTDGTEAGTVRVKDIYTGTSGSVITKLVLVGNTLYFGATDTTHGWELWKSDGTEAGTVLVKDIYASGNVGSEVDELVNLNGTLYFRARGTSPITRTNIWTSDGTDAGTVPVTDIGYTTSSSNISNLTNVNGTLYFLSTDAGHGKELWALDPTGAFLVKDILPGSASSTITDMTSLGGILYFATNDFQSGNELWRSDGTTAGTFAIDAVLPGGAAPQNIRVAGNKLIYSALSDAFGRELSSYDPTPAGAPAPEVQVTWQAEDIPDQTGILDFGNIQFGTSAVKTIKVRNTGTADLILQPATVPTGFLLLTNFTPNQIVAPGEFTTLTIQLDTTSVADHDVQLSFGTNDSDEGPFNFSLKASVNTPLVFLTPLGPTSLNEADAQPVELILTRTYVADISQSLFVNLLSSNEAAIHSPASVRIPANATSVKVRIYLRNDGDVDGTQSSVVSASTAGYRSQEGASYSVSDDDTVAFRTLGGYLTGTLTNNTYHVIQNLLVDDADTFTVSPGTTLLFNPGTGLNAYGKLIADGTTADPITFTSNNSSPSPGDWSGIHVNSDTGTQNILDNVDVSYATSGIRVYSGGGGGVGVATITNSNIHHNRFGIDVEGYNSSAYATITGNKIQHNELVGINVYSEGTSTQSSEDGYASVTIKNNEISDNGTGVDVSSEGTEAFITNAVSSGDTFATLEGNWIHHNNVGISADSYAGAGFGIADAFVSLTAYRNVISDNVTRGVHLIVSESGGFVSKLVGNTILNNGQEGVYQFLDDTNDLTFKNNLVAGNQAGGVVSSAVGWIPDAGLVGYNDVYGNTTGNWIGYPANFGNNTTTNAWGTPSDNEFNISVDPVFATAGDYHLTSSSPLIDAGVIVAGAPTTDIDGNPIVNLPDIGADEVLILSISSTSVNENSTIGTTVGVLQLSDPNSVASTTYQFMESGSYPDNALFTLSGASLKMAALFNFEVKSLYQIKVRAIPPTGPAIDQVFTISVTDVNEAPTDIGLSNSAVAENSAIGTSVGNFSSTDPDAGNTFTYSLVTGTGSKDNASFAIVGNSLQTTGVFDFESKNSYSIRVRSTDQVGLSFEKVFTISATNINDAPDLIDVGSPMFDPVRMNAGAANIPGTLVSDLIVRMAPSGGINDPDIGDLKGIAVNGLTNTSDGAWQYTINNGTNWNPVGTTGNTDARLLASDLNTRIRFIPNPGFSGLVRLAFVAWDRTSGANGETANVSSRGGSTPFSLEYEYADLSVLPSSPNAVGVWRAGKYYLDANNNHVWNNTTGGDQLFSFGSSTDTPIVGDWNGDGITDLGAWRAGKFYIDSNGNHIWDNVSGGDRVISFGATTDIPIAGDWNGDGKTDIGVFRSGKFYLDNNGNGKWDGIPGGDQYLSFGTTGDLPVIGDWNGDGFSDIGIIRNGKFYLDANGNRAWNNLTGGDAYFSFGTAGDKPISGDWNNDGKSDVGIVRGNTFYLDANGNRTWNNTTGGDTKFVFGLASDTPVVGLWKLPSNARVPNLTSNSPLVSISPIVESASASTNNINSEIPLETLIVSGTTTKAQFASSNPNSNECYDLNKLTSLDDIFLELSQNCNMMEVTPSEASLLRDILLVPFISR